MRMCACLRCLRVYFRAVAKKNFKTVIIIYVVYFCLPVCLKIIKSLPRNKENMIMWNSTERIWRPLILVATGRLYVRNCKLLCIRFLWTNLLSAYRSENCLKQSLRQQHRQYMGKVISRRVRVTVITVDRC